MGIYLKVQGNLILISSDPQHSMETILPQDQMIIPVSLKRKIHYKCISIGGVNTILEFSRTKLSEFERKLTEGTEEYVKHSDCKIIEDEVEKECISGYTSEDPLEHKTLKTCNQIIIFLNGWGQKLRGQLKKRVLKKKNEFQT